MDTPDISYGRLLGFLDVSSYSAERAVQDFKKLITDGNWKKVGGGYEDIDDFLQSINLEAYKVGVQDRKEIAVILDGLHATKRATARALGVSHPTILRDIGTNVPDEENVKNNLLHYKDLGKQESRNGTNVPQKPKTGAELVIEHEKKAEAESIREEKRAEVTTKLEDIAVKEAKAVQGIYDVIVLDPPWPMQKIERDVAPNQVSFEYPTMSEEELEQLEIPTADNCHIFVWTTHKFLPMALRLIEHWGYKYVLTMVWHKPGGFQPFGLPQYNCEFAIYARKGTPQFIDTKAFPTCFNAPRGAHSAKPEEFYEVLRRVTAGRRLDMFNRRDIEGFDKWGNEA